MNFIFDKILFNQEIKEPIIVSSPFQNSILDIVEIIQSHINFENKVIFDKSNNIGEQVKVVNTHKLNEVIGDFSFTDLKTGIQKTIDWYISQ